MWFLLVDYSQYFEASTVKIATQARYLHLTSWRTFCTPHGVQRELQCRFRWNGMQNHHRIHIPKSPPGQKLPPLGILIKLNWLFRWDVAQRMLGVPKWNPIPGEVQGFPVSASSQRWRWTHYFSFKVTVSPLCQQHRLKCQGEDSVLWSKVRISQRAPKHKRETSRVH